MPRSMTSAGLGLGLALRPLGVLACGLGMFACLGPNPRLDAGADTSGSESSGDGDGDASGDGDGDGAPTSETETDTDTEPDPCTNQQLDPGEADIDCGGDCPLPCADGLACTDGQDCASQVCTDDICQAPTCEDTVHNGDEVDVDCGGPCVFCQHSVFQQELDDFEGTGAGAPQVAIFGDGNFAVSYASSTEARVRWFDEFAEPLGASVEIDPTILHKVNAISRIEPRADDTLSVSVVELGQDMQSSSTDAFLVGRDPSMLATKFLLNDPQDTVDPEDIDIAANGDRLIFVWTDNNDVYLRRWDYGNGQGGDWVDITATYADPDPGGNIGYEASVAVDAEGLAVVAWNRCDAGGLGECSVVVRRYQDMWLDPQPLTVSNESGAATSIKAAVGADGRIFVAWLKLGLGEAYPRAAIVNADFTLDGLAWELQPVVYAPFNLDVEALSDGSFAVAWTDFSQDAIHLRRFVGANLAKLPQLGDEATWGDVTDPTWVSLDSIDGRLVVVWSATVDLVKQIQGQVFSY